MIVDKVFYPVFKIGRKVAYQKVYRILLLALINLK